MPRSRDIDSGLNLSMSHISSILGNEVGLNSNSPPKPIARNLSLISSCVALTRSTNFLGEQRSDTTLSLLTGSIFVICRLCKKHKQKKTNMIAILNKYKIFKQKIIKKVQQFFLPQQYLLPEIWWNCPPHDASFYWHDDQTMGLLRLDLAQNHQDHRH